MRSLFRTILTLAILVGLYVGYREILGRPDGGPCASTHDCKRLFGVQCLQDDTGSYCSLPCTTDHDCPQTWRCAAAHAPDGRTATEAVCSRSPNAVHAAPPPAATPATPTHSGAGH